MKTRRQVRSAVIEGLEGRRLLSGAAAPPEIIPIDIGAGASLHDGTLNIDIDAEVGGGISIRVQDGTLSVRYGSDASLYTFAASDVKKISVGGNPNAARNITLDASVNIPAEIWGSLLADSIVGGSGNDTIHGGVGADTIKGGGGDDVIYGGRGADLIFGGEGNDSILGGMGRDTIHGNAGNDTIRGGEGNDLLSGGRGNDEIHGNAGRDTLFGREGDDVLYGGRGADELHGNTGDDVLSGMWGNDTVSGGQGLDFFRHEEGLDTYVDSSEDFYWRNSGAEDQFLASPACSLAAQANDRFGFDLYGKLAETTSGNVFCSPISASTALSMLAMGAKGQTATEMSDVLRQQGITPADLGRLGMVVTDGTSNVELANKLWVQQGMSLRPEFSFAAQDDFGATPGMLDFQADPEQARGVINDWGAHETHGRITNVLPPGSVTEQTRLAVANAIYFKADWANPFDASDTASETFTLADGTQKATPLMHQTHYLRYYGDSEVQVVELPYVGGQVMDIILPSQNGGVSNIEHQLNSVKLNGWLSNLSIADVSLSLPKFRIATDSMDLIAALQSLGMTTAFTNAADFSGITADDRLYVATVYQKAMVDVTESGTEAAAVTGGVVTTSAIYPTTPAITMNADHPFVFLIRDARTSTTLFAGRMAEPQAA